MSSWAQAMVAARNAVAVPTQAMTTEASGALFNSGLMRHSRYTPAVTMVAAWMSADTGVGPSMASGSHTKRGSCADFPTHPKNKARQIHVAVVWPMWESAELENTST